MLIETRLKSISTWRATVLIILASSPAFLPWANGLKAAPAGVADGELMKRNGVIIRRLLAAGLSVRPAHPASSAMLNRDIKNGRMTGWRFWTSLCALLVMQGAAFGADDTTDQFAKVRQDIRDRYSDVRQISTVELATWLNDKTLMAPVLLDVRTAAEYAVSHLINARRVDPGKPSRELLQTLDPKRSVVVYCSVGARSSEFARQLQRSGFLQVLNLDGSIFQWANEGRQLYSGDQSTMRVHPYSRKWGRYLNKNFHAPTEKEK